MGIESRRKKILINAGRQTAFVLAALVLIVAACVFAFLEFYNRYDYEILYAERLNQMKEVTEQLFSGLEDVVDVQWDNALYQYNYLNDQAPETVDELAAIMDQQTAMAGMDIKQIELIAIDSEGRYYSRDGRQGLISDMSYMEGRPKRLSYVFNNLTASLVQMLFLYRLDDPITVSDGDKTAQIIYYGIAEDMEQLNPYFDCKAYNGSNSTYVVDPQGLKLFSGNGSNNILEGFNVFSALRSMNYLHDSSFDDTLRTMQDTGLAYSNANMNGEEYYYALYRMENAEWILVFLVPSAYVAVNTVQLVNTTTRMLLVFAVFMTLICAAMIFFVLRIQQQRALKAAEETNEVLEANNRKLEEAQAAANEALKAAEAASKAKTEFLSNMSHDIRTPMNAIVGITKLMAHDKNDPVKINTYIGKMQQSSQHLLSLINDVLDMSKIESGEVVLNSEPVSIAEQVRQIESIVRPQIEDRGQKFIIRTHNITHEHFVGDAVRLRQVFINLLSNAVKYTPYGGNIRLDITELPSGTKDHAWIRIAVTDSGYGMTHEFMEHIFEPFTRAENSTTNRVQGTGLGMAITKNIVDMAGGTISIQSEVGRGSCFTVELPFLIDSDIRTELPIDTALLITDDDTLISNAQAGLKAAGVRLLTAGTEAAADELLRKNKFDIVLLGSHLNGDTLDRNLHRLRRNAGNALLFYCCDYEDREQLGVIAEKGGVDGVLVRPFFVSDVALAIELAHGDAADEVPESASVLNGMRFLCAEDNALNAEILQALLDMSGAECVIYPDGKQITEAFASVKPGDFDAILMDVQMPVMDGLDAARAIRQSDNPLGRTIPIIAMTANAFSDDVQNCLNAGMDAHVSKPLDMAALERTMKSISGGKCAGGAAVRPKE